MFFLYVNRPFDRALVTACLICSIPSAFISLLQGSPITLFSFFTVAVIHGYLLGLPTYWMLKRAGLLNAMSCTLAGLLIATLPYALFFSRRASGPGANHTEALAAMALAGPLIGLLFWIFIRKILESQRLTMLRQRGQRREQKPSRPKVPVDPKERARVVHNAVNQAVEQFKAKVPVTAACARCGHPISVIYNEPPADSFVTRCECRTSNKILRGICAPPDWVIRSREQYVSKAAGKDVLDATFYAIYFNEYKSGDYFDCPIDPRSLSPGASEAAISDAIHRCLRLCKGRNAYVGAAFFKHPDEPLSYEQAVQKLKRDNPGFSEAVYNIVIDDNIRGMR